MAVLMVFVVYLTITGYISGQENQGKGLQAALTNIVKDDIQNLADLDKDEKPLETKPQGLDENTKLFKEDKSASDLSSKKISKEGHREGEQKNEAGIFKPIVPKSHSNRIQIKHNPNKPAVHNANDQVFPKKHLLAKKTLSKAVARTDDKNDGILPNGGKMVHAKLPDSLLLKQVPKPLGHFAHAQLKTGKVHRKRPRKNMKTSKNKSKKGRGHGKKGGGHGKKGRGHGKKVAVHAEKQLKVSKKSRKQITKKKMPHKA